MTHKLGQCGALRLVGEDVLHMVDGMGDLLSMQWVPSNIEIFGNK